MKHQNNRKQRTYQSYVQWFSKMKLLYRAQPGSAHLLSIKHMKLPEEEHKREMVEAMNLYVEEMNKYKLFKNKRILRVPR